MSGQTIVVTGGAGFIGSHLVDRLLARGDAVVCVDDFNDAYDPALKRENVAPHRDAAAFRVVELDVREREPTIALVRELRPDAVVHLAARAGVRPSLANPWLYQETNVGGTLNVLEACRLAGVERFVFGSSSSVYGCDAAAPFAEDALDLRPASPYAATKIAGEAMVHSYAHLYGIQATSLRFFTVYGPRQRPDLAISKFTAGILRGAPIELFGDGTSSRDYTHVDDIVAGTLAALDRAAPGYAVFNLGSARPTSLRSLVAALEGIIGVAAKIEWSPAQPGDVPRTHAALERARAELGYAPAVSLVDGLADFIRWLRPRL
ncbi:MAG: NAD-dependent epimerase/dehydratase family protein [Myxococcales bacterium]|nr:NAD-dependent epimerase/dehydratase family protein [Myxococcales bacterium]